MAETKTLEQMAEEAGIPAPLDDVGEELRHFAALVAERCAEIVGLSCEYTEHNETGASIAQQILAEFPKS